MNGLIDGITESIPSAVKEFIITNEKNIITVKEPKSYFPLVLFGIIIPLICIVVYIIYTKWGK